MQLSLVSSSLSALDQIKMSKIKSRKKIWITSFILATLLAIYQTTSIICSYLDTPIKQSEIEVMSDVNLVATVCFTNPISYNNTDLSEEQSLILKKMQNLSADCDIYQPSLFCLSLLSERDRFKIGFLVDQDQFILVFGVGVYQVFNNLLYGNCAILRNDLNKNLKAFETKLLYIFVKNRKQLPLIMVIHEDGTFPVIKTTSIILLNSQEMRVLANAKKTLFKSELIGVNCIAKTRQPMQMWNIMENEERSYAHYIYSYENCLDQCLYALTKQYCKCILPNSMRGQNVEMLPLCHQYCNKIPEDEMETMCNCKSSCENAEVTANRQINKLDDEQTILSLIIQYMYQYESDEEWTVKNLFKRKEADLYFHEVFISQSLTTKITVMESAIKLEDALSTIGGIWGFWMGLSISVLLAIAIDILPSMEKSFFNFQRCLKILHRTLWFVGMIFIITVLIWQLYVIITEYLSHNVLRVTTTTALDSRSFPSVYVCYEGEICTREDELQNNTNLLEKINDYKMKPERYHGFYESFTEEERELLLPKISDIVESCKLETNTKLALPCPLQPQKLEMFEPWRCAIINASEALKFNDISNIQSLKMKLQYPRCFRSPGAPLFVGFNPLSNEEARIFVTPGDRVNVKYLLTETNRLPSPYTSQCIDENTKYSWGPSTLTNLSNLINYSYNFKDCLSLCIYALNEDNDCNLNKKRAPGLNASDNPCSHATNFDICGCKPSCKDRDYTFKITKTEYAFKKKTKYFNFSTVAEVEDYVRQGFAVINIEGESYQKTVISEKPTIETDSLVGLIGGISGLWIGQSLLTLIVELHTLCTIIVTKILSFLKR